MARTQSPSPTFERRAFDFYRSQGWTIPQAAALASRANVESGGSTTVLGDKGTSQGLFQWHLDRRQGLFDFAKARGLDPRDEGTQFAYSQWELTDGPERAAGAALRDAQDPTQAATAVMRYVRPAGYTPDDPTKGLGYGRTLAGTLALAGGGSQEPIGSPPQGLPTGPSQTAPVLAFAAPESPQPQGAATPRRPLAFALPLETSAQNAAPLQAPTASVVTPQPDNSPSLLDALTTAAAGSSPNAPTKKDKRLVPSLLQALMS